MREQRITDREAVLPDVKQEGIFLSEHQGVTSVDLHGHEMLELTYVLQGKAEHCADGSTGELTAGDYMIMDCGSSHSYRAALSEGLDHIDCLFLPEVLDSSLKGTKSLRGIFERYLLYFNRYTPVQNPTKIVFHDRDGRVLTLLQSMRREQLEKKAGYTELMRCYLTELILLTLRNLEDAAVASESEVCGFLAEYVRQHYREQITLGELAERLGYSLPYLSRKFREDMGVSFVTYLQNCRVMEGCRLLASSNSTLTEIAEAVGYRDVKFFAATVKRHTGLTPSEFRKKHTV